jgi:BirA family transcriptional regulator, biotin operon repressor / biotin---[acetyl-CoA-carboxylase] ligase
VIAFDDGWLDPGGWRVLENCVCMQTVGSSNALARELIELYMEEGLNLRATVLAALAQTEAYGRGGRQWVAPPGRGLYLTLVRPAREAEPLSLLPIAAARWLREVLREQTGTSAGLKWPNDLYAGRRKLAGVMAESRTQGDETYVAIGLGVNVRGPSAELGVPNATTLEEETGSAPVPARLLQALLDRFDRELAAPRWDDEVREWELASVHHPGDRLTVRRNGGEISGEYAGLDPSGFLRLRTSSGEEVVSAGEVAEW